MSSARVAPAADGAAVLMRRRYFTTISVITLALTAWSFRDNLFWRMHQPAALRIAGAPHHHGGSVAVSAAQGTIKAA